MKYVKGDLVEAFKRGEVKAIAHQVNCQGVMGSGIAKQIREAFPTHYDDYKKHLTKNWGDITPLGTCVETHVYDVGMIFGLLGQYNYGRDGKRYTNYVAFANALDYIWCKEVGIPKYIACGTGGGDWSIVETLLKDYEKMANMEFIVYEL